MVQTQNYNTAATSPNASSTMKISTTVTVYDNVELDIELPYYCRHEDDFYCIQTETKSVRVMTGPNYCSVTKTSTDIWINKIAKATICTKQDFIKALDQVLTNMEATTSLEFERCVHCDNPEQCAENKSCLYRPTPPNKKGGNP